MDEATEVELHLQGTVPIFESEHGAPVEPEVGVQHLVTKVVCDGLVVELLVGGEEQLHDLHGPGVGQAELPVGVTVLPTVLGGPHEGVVGVPFVEIVVLVQHAQFRVLNGGNGSKQVPHHLEVVVHLTAAPHHIPQARVLPAVAGPAGDRILLKDMDAFSRHLPISHQVAGSSQSCQTGSNNIGRFSFHTLRFEWPNKSFIVSTGIIHSNDLPRHFFAFIVSFLQCPNNKQSLSDDENYIIREAL